MKIISGMYAADLGRWNSVLQHEGCNCLVGLCYGASVTGLGYGDSIYA